LTVSPDPVAGAGPAATDEVRRRNTAVVLRLLRDEGALSRTELARRSGLAKATIGTIVGDLEHLGVLVPAPQAPVPPGRGRPSTPLRLDGSRHAGVGIEVNVDYLAVTLLDLAGEERWFEETPRGRPPRPADVLRLAREHLRRLQDEGAAALGLTVAVPGLIDRAAGRVVRAPNLGWEDVPLVAQLHHGIADLGTDVTVAVDNDANCAARAERVHGVAAGIDDFVYLTGTVGLGAGIVSGGRVLRGARGLAGEVGHLRVGDDGDRCACGRTGCWEALVGLRALERATGLETAPGEDPVAYAERLAAAPSARPGLEVVAYALGRGVAQLSATLDPRMVVLGGAFVPLADVLVPAVEAALTVGFTGPGAQVALSTLGLHAASVGAAVDALEDVYSGRRSLVG
jgi:predicted NBD/HSP70 family sugar kinase